jgi:cell division protein FtsI (penicillin-binding protein 3)
MAAEPPLLRDYQRLLLLTLGVITLLAILLSQYYRLQILEGDYWEQRAQRQHFLNVEVPAQRGIFYGTTATRAHPVPPVPLVHNVRQYHLYVDPQIIPQPVKVAVQRRIATQLNLTWQQEAFIALQLARRSRSRSLGLALSPYECRMFEKWWAAYAKDMCLPRHALFCVPGWRRSHPYGDLLGQVLHTVQHRAATVQQEIPTGGLELTFDSVLRGKKGSKRLRRSPRHTFETGQFISPPSDGAAIMLTIDPYLQALVETELAKGVARSGAKGGWAVMMNPQNGELMALAQCPAFVPDDYQRYFNDPLISDHVRLNALTEAHEPGSVVKPLTVALALMANDQLQAQGLPTLFNIHEKIATSSGNFPGRSRPLQDTQLHYYLNMHMAIRKSSNIYMGRLVERILAAFGADWYRSQLTNVFGLGLKTGIELPGESGGFVPEPGQKYSGGKSAWSKSTPFSLAIGYNLQATALQLVRAYAVLANGGYLVQPTLIHRETTTRCQVLQPEVVKEVVKAMKYVTKTGGSAQRADIFGYTEAGKSSTAKKISGGAYSETLYIGSFIGFAPAEQAAFVLLITLDEPTYGYFAGYGKNHNGGNCAAVVFRAIGRRALAYLGWPYDDPHGFPKGDPRRAKGLPDWSVETEQLQEIYQKWNNPL